MKKVSTRLAAVIAVGTLSAFGAGFAAPAFAQNTTAPEAGVETAPAPVTPSNTSVIDDNADVKLTITKYLGEPGDTNTPLSGTEFKVERVDVDLTTQDGWKKMAGYTAENAPIDGDFTAKTKKTGDDGVVTFDSEQDGLKVGAYKVTEINRNGYTTAPPFLVTLPHDENGEWAYTQSVEPKNQKIVPSKQVKDAGATIGEQLTYTVNAPVPAETLSRFIIQDPLNSALSVKTEDVKVSLEGATNGATPVSYTHLTLPTKTIV